MSKKDRSASRQREKRNITIICALLGAVIIALAGYAAGWYGNRARIERDAERYQEMYSTPIPAPTSEAHETPATPTPSPTPTATPEATPEPAETPEGSLQPKATANADTLVMALPTPPPPSDTFSLLLQHNPDTVGWLIIPDALSLPVVQRENDNLYYLDHNFDGREEKEGTLFLDGVNRLVPEDDCLIVYGHNMKNGTMFGGLSRYAKADFMKSHAIVQFDTLYASRKYVPFAAFSASMAPDSSRYFEVRQFIFDETEFELFTLKLQQRSALRLPVDVRYGDRLLLLVTCDYSNQDGRFILALRQLREDENEDDMRALFAALS